MHGLEKLPAWTAPSLPLTGGFAWAVYVGFCCCFVWPPLKHVTLKLATTAIYACFCCFDYSVAIAL